MKTKSNNITIVGGGMVGMTIACALAKQTRLSIAILEAHPEINTWSPDKYYHRVSAISLSSVRILNSLGVWPRICAKRVSPFTHIHVWDEAPHGQIDFDSRDIAEPVLGYIVENAAIQAALYEQLCQFPQIDYIPSVKLQSLTQSNSHAELQAADGRIFNAKLLVAADGAHSWLREQAGIRINTFPYEQKAIVATVKTALPHQKTARQVFLQTGPLAFLPLLDTHTSSIVWSLPTTQAEDMLTLSDEDFSRKLAHAFSDQLGAITHVDKRFAFPLQKQQAVNYIKDRIVLAGDAAHTIHPLAGQGINMGLLDAASLVEVIANACEKQRDYASLHTLRRYERWRKADNASLLLGVDMIKRLFDSDKKTIQTLRSHGLSMADSAPFIRNIFTRHAVGNRGDLPRLATAF